MTPCSIEEILKDTNHNETKQGQPSEEREEAKLRTEMTMASNSSMNDQDDVVKSSDDTDIDHQSSGDTEMYLKISGENGTYAQCFLDLWKVPRIDKIR